uniref:Uncharacterized protein n=1 Tax=Anguilla anguilla TaxID=7936 RepID=A0A0E9REG2_ANGAN
MPGSSQDFLPLWSFFSPLFQFFLPPRNFLTLLAFWEFRLNFP